MLVNYTSVNEQCTHEIWHLNHNVTTHKKMKYANENIEMCIRY